MNMKKQIIRNTLAPITLCVLCSLPAFAEEQETDLETIKVSAVKQAKSKQNVSGLGELRKNAQQLQQEQVENIRDLTRYDSGIGVVEASGRGTSRGFSIRGVDQDRVAVSLDGFESSATLKRHDTSGTYSAISSASKNEVEYEELKQVDIKKGAASAESGSGALGGTVAMVTKTIDDFVPRNKTVGGTFKTNYTSKDGRKLLSGGVGVRLGKFAGFVQFSHRDGHEIRVHPDLYKGRIFVENYSDPVDPSTQKKGRWVSMNELSGIRRQVPNPLRYRSDSLLSKAGWYLTPEDYVGIVLNHTKQQYPMRDMLVANYHHGYEKFNIHGQLLTEKRLYNESSTPMAKYTPTQFFKDTHHNTRIGLEYLFNPQGKDNLIDAATINLDYRKLLMNSEIKRLNCAPWPTVDPNCFPTSIDEINNGQRAWLRYADASQKDLRLNIAIDKRFKYANTRHDLRLNTGMVYSTYGVVDRDRYIKVSYHTDGLTNTRIFDGDNNSSLYITSPIYGWHGFIGLSDSIRFNDDWFASVAARYDRYIFDGQNIDLSKTRAVYFKRSQYQNLSWDVGLKYYITPELAATYRSSSGFRVPSIYEQLGPGFAASPNFVQGPLEAERSFNHELGLKYEHDVINVKASIFLTTYHNMIALASKKQAAGQGRGDVVYYNPHRVRAKGFDLEGSFHPHELYAPIPEGLRLFSRLSKTEQIGGPARVPEGYEGRGYSLDSVQPLRWVYGINYTAPNDAWGITIVNTYSKGKNEAELYAVDYSPLGDVNESYSTVSTRPWAVADIFGHYRVNKHITLRAGIYNIFNYRYITWEAARQTAWTGGLESNLDTPNYTVVAAPGRNFSATLEIKF